MSFKPVMQTGASFICQLVQWFSSKRKVESRMVSVVVGGQPPKIGNVPGMRCESERKGKFFKSLAELSALQDQSRRQASCLQMEDPTFVKHSFYTGGDTQRIKVTCTWS